MYQPPRRREEPRYFGLTGLQLNTGFLLLLAGAIGSAAAWLFAFGGVATVNDTFDRLQHQVMLLVSGRDVPSAAVDVPDGWLAVEPDAATEKALVDSVRATNPELARAMERELSYFGGLEILFLAYEPHAPQGSFTTVDILGQRFSSSTTLQEEIAFIETQLPLEGTTIVSVTSDLTIGGFPAGFVDVRGHVDGVAMAGLQYIVLAEPDLVFTITFTTTADRIGELTPVFQQVAGTFHLTDE